MFLILMKLEV